MTIFYITSVLTCIFALIAALFISYIAAHMEGPEDEKITNYSDISGKPIYGIKVRKIDNPGEFEIIDANNKESKHIPGIIYTHNYASDIVDVVINSFGERGLLSDKFYDSESEDSINAHYEAYDESLTMVESMISEAVFKSAKGAKLQVYKYSESGKRYEEFESKND